MSNNESFIDEVNEEVRRDQLFGYVRKYGWIAALAVIGLVGGTAYGEYKSAQTRAAAQEKGDAIFAALAENDWAERQAAFETLPRDVVELLLTGVAASENGDTDAALAAYNELAALDGARPVYRELGQFKAALIASEGQDPATRIAAFEPMAAPGATFGLLAREQIAVAQAQSGDVDAALATLETISNDALASEGLRNRIGQLIVALGGDTAQ